MGWEWGQSLDGVGTGPYLVTVQLWSRNDIAAGQLLPVFGRGRGCLLLYRCKLAVLREGRPLGKLFTPVNCLDAERSLRYHIIIIIIIIIIMVA